MKIKKTLVVFDFDGTLFKSPLKPKDWKGAWWSNIKSLTPPLMPEKPDDSWWNDKVCEDAFEALSNPEYYTVMLTGRIDRVFNERVNQLLDQKGLSFPYVGLAKLSTSIDSKIQHLNKLLSDNPYFEKIIFYDDREEHFPLFEQYCKEKDLECEVIAVKESYTLLEGQEKPENKVYVMVGPPGVGKSTYIKNNSAMKNCIIISRDSIVERVAEENGYTYTELFNNTPEIKELNKQIDQELENNINNASKGGRDVVVDKTNMNIKARASILNRFPRNKFTRIALDFMPDISNFDNLMKSNEFRNIELTKSGKNKNISRLVLQMMFDRYEPPTEEEGFDRVTEIDVNPRLAKFS
jgi:GTPase Era involved in 16S rRNA processing